MEVEKRHQGHKCNNKVPDMQATIHEKDLHLTDTRKGKAKSIKSIKST